MPYETFWHLNPKKLRPFIDAYKIKRNIKNEEMWMLGLYQKAALECTVGNIFKKTTEKQNEYPARPYTFFDKKEAESTDETLSEDNKRKMQQQLLFQLQIMESNFKTRKKPE